MLFYGQRLKTNAKNGNPVDQSLCNRFSELIDEYQVCETGL